MLKKLKRALRGKIDGYIDYQRRAHFLGTSPEIKLAQLQLFTLWRSMALQGQALPSPQDAGCRVLSGTDDDGRLLFLFALLGFKTRKFVDVGSGNCVTSNCANLVLNFGFHGLFIDGNPKNIERGQQFYSKHPDTCLYPPRFECDFVKAENINEIISRNGIGGEIDLLSVDIDGNDYWVWKAISCVQPRVVIIETHIEFGLENIVVPYDPDYCYPGKHPQYHGASPKAMAALGKAKGYRLVGTNLYGFNFIFVKNGEGDRLLPEISIEEALKHPRNAERTSLSEEIKDWKYIRG